MSNRIISSRDCPLVIDDYANYCQYRYNVSFNSMSISIVKMQIPPPPEKNAFDYFSIPRRFRP